ncbi:MAG: DUF302 domain-containing protein [Actinomycetota bacterium]|nr:DUF302 domain-containing protein [Actinomycetota bacterium]
MEYTFGTVVVGTMEAVEEKVTAALAGEGFGVLTRIDVQATFKAKLDVERDGYVILGACNPNLAYRAIAADDEIGALLPCNVVLREEGDAVAVRVADPDVMLSLAGADGVAAIGAEARERLSRVVAALA